MVQVVETADSVPGLDQPPRDVKADEAGGSGDQNWLVHGNQPEE